MGVTRVGLVDLDFGFRMPSGALHLGDRLGWQFLFRLDRPAEPVHLRTGLRTGMRWVVLVANAVTVMRDATMEDLLERGRAVREQLFDEQYGQQTNNNAT